MKRFELSPNAYYNFLKNRKKEYLENKEKLQCEIKDIFHSEGGKMGYRMVHSQLDKRGIKLCLLTVHKYMKELGLQSVVTKKKPAYVKGTIHKVFPNLLNRDFTASNKNKKWCTDFTYIRLSTGKMMYNCAILDLYDRSIVASKTDVNITSELAIATLEEALNAHKPPKGLIIHSDQGSQYTSNTFTGFCEKNKIKQSMSKAGCPYDNAAMESFYGKLKNEHINHYSIKNAEHLNELLDDYIFRYYHHKRPHSSLGGLTPFEMRYSKKIDLTVTI